MLTTYLTEYDALQKIASGSYHINSLLEIILEYIHSKQIHRHTHRHTHTYTNIQFTITHTFLYNVFDPDQVALNQRFLTDVT